MSLSAMEGIRLPLETKEEKQKQKKKTKKKKTHIKKMQTTNKEETEEGEEETHYDFNNKKLGLKLTLSKKHRI